MIGNTQSQERRKARRALLQVLYEADASGHALDDSLQFVLGLACLSEEGNEFVSITHPPVYKIVAQRVSERLNDEVTENTVRYYLGMA